MVFGNINLYLGRACSPHKQGSFPPQGIWRIRYLLIAHFSVYLPYDALCDRLYRDG
jgi:hypothetical protein